MTRSCTSSPRTWWHHPIYHPPTSATQPPHGFRRPKPKACSERCCHWNLTGWTGSAHSSGHSSRYQKMALSKKYFTSSYPHHDIYTLCYWQIFWHSIWHIFWHFIWHIFWHSIWHIFWRSTWHIFCNMFWHTYLAYLLAYLLTFYLAFYLAYLLAFFLSGISSNILSGISSGTLPGISSGRCSGLKTQTLLLPCRGAAALTTRCYGLAFITWGSWQDLLLSHCAQAVPGHTYPAQHNCSSRGNTLEAWL